MITRTHHNITFLPISPSAYLLRALPLIVMYTPPELIESSGWYVCNEEDRGRLHDKPFKSLDTTARFLADTLAAIG